MHTDERISTDRFNEGRVTTMSRREFVSGAAMAGAAAALGAERVEAAQAVAERGGGNADVPVIDSHIHLFDPTRAVFTGYMGSGAYRALNKPSLPGMYESLARPEGVVGAIVVESSAWIDDNLWYLDVCRADPFMVGVCGSLDPARADFGQYVAHFARDPLYRAIRTSRFYSEDGGKVALKQDQAANLRHLAQADLALDTANPSMGLMWANVMLADAIPGLRIIMDHLPSFDATAEGRAAYEEVVKEMAARPNIYVKLSEVYHPRLDNGMIVKEWQPLKERLDYLYGMFGEDRVIFGSDYPNSYGVATVAEEVGLMRRYFADKPRAAAEKYFWRNSAKVYKWNPRTKEQPAA